MDTFYLEILSPERTFYAGQCRSLTMPITDGMLGVMAHHTPLTAAIMDGEIHFETAEGERVVCAVTRGMADVADNRVQVLCASALRPDEIDEAQERRALELAQQELRRRQSEKDYRLWQLSFNQAMNRLKVKKKDQSVNI